MFTRFTWFEFDPDLARGDKSARDLKAKRLAGAVMLLRDASSKYERAFKHGDEAAIHRYANEAAGALLDPWVLAVMYRWHAENSANSKHKIRRLISAWVDSRGKARPTELFDVIRRDKTIAIKVLSLRRQGKTVESAILQVARELSMREETVREIHRHYADFSKNALGSPRQPVNYGRALEHFNRTEPEAVWERVMSIWDEEAIAFVLEQQIRRLQAFGRIALHELRPTPRRPGAFLDRLLWGLKPRQQVRVRLTRSKPVRLGTVPPTPEEGYLRLEFFEQGKRRPDRTLYWEWRGAGNLELIPDVSTVYREVAKSYR